MENWTNSIPRNESMSPEPIRGKVLAVCLKAEPGLPKHPADHIMLVRDHGVEGDYHAGRTIRHRYLAKKDPTQPNNRQMLLVDTKILDYLKSQGIVLRPCELGENILLDGIDLMALEIGSRLEIGPALIELTEVREPCHQLDGIRPGLQDAVRVFPGEKSTPRAGMLAVVLRGGDVKSGDPVRELSSQTGRLLGSA